MKKRILSIVLACVLVVSILAGSVLSVSADEGKAKPNPYRLPVYTPSSGVTTYTTLFAMPGVWTNDTTKKQDNACGLYWWDAPADDCDKYPEANGHGWPGWKMVNVDEAGVENLRSSLVPVGTPNMIYSNFIDGGMDEAEPEYADSQQVKDLSVEYFACGDSDYMPYEVWDAVFAYEDDFYDDPNFAIAEFGDYSKNFYFNDDAGDIVMDVNNMIFVVDIVDTSRAMLSPVSGKLGLDGAYYFYYGNGEFGVWPTKAMCIEKEGLPTDEAGNVDLSSLEVTEEPTTAAVEETTAKDEGEEGGADGSTTTDSKLKIQERTGFVLNERTDAYEKNKGKDVKRDFVVYGNITGKYWKDTTPVPSPDNPDATEIGPASTDPTSSEGDKKDEDGGNNSNGAIATGQTSVYVVVGIVSIAALGVFFYIRRRRSSK